MHPAHDAVDHHQKALRGLIEDLHNPHRRPKAVENERVAWQDLIMVLSRSEPFYWTKKGSELVKHLMRDFNMNEIVLSRELLYNDYGFHYFEHPLMVAEATDDSGDMIPIHAITWAWGERKAEYQVLPGVHGLIECLFVTAWVFQPDTIGVRLVPFIYALRENGKAMTFDEHDVGFGAPNMAETDMLLQFVVAASTFLRQKLIRTESLPVPSYMRKRFSRENNLSLRSGATVQVVQLRKIEQRTHEQGSETDQLTEWSCQWTVRGHVRQQWYGSLQKHLPVWIHPYVKGPEDKPLKPRTTSIMVVNR